MSNFDRMVSVPATLNVENLTGWSQRLFGSPPHRRTLFNFSEVQHAPPFGMLFVASCVRRYQRLVVEKHWVPFPQGGQRAEVAEWYKTYPVVEITPNIKNSYLSHMGFWQSMAVELGKVPGEAVGSSRYLPVTMLNREALEQKARSRSFELGDAINDEAERLAEILSQGSGDAIEVTLSYAIRELLRNVFEHSGATGLWYSAQYWPSRDTVEFAVLDEGVGIQESLRKNPAHSPRTEVQAIILSTERGVTGAIPKPALRSLYGESAESRWTNAGWGLFVLRQLAEQAGSLLVVSNSAAASFTGSALRSFTINHSGAIVRLVLRPSALKDLLREILRKSTETDPPSKLTPSMLARLRNSNF